MRTFNQLAFLGTLFQVLIANSPGEGIRVPDGQPWNSPFAYRSISFGTPSRSGPPAAMGTSVTGTTFDGIQLNLNRDLVRLAAGLGFNDVTIQTEQFTVAKLEALRKWADETGNFTFIKNFPEDVIVMSKCVPQDWHLRGVDNPVIGQAGQHNQHCSTAGPAEGAAAPADAQIISPNELADPYRPAYHLTPPVGGMGDPNGLCWYQGQYHLFYLDFWKWPADKDPSRWAHVVSDDMVHWKPLPPAFAPGDPCDSRACWSGCLRLIDGVPTIFYSGLGAGGVSACLATSPDMIHWSKADFNPLMEPDALRRGWDHCVWKEGDTWLMLTGGKEGAQLFASRDLRRWEYLHPLLAEDPKRGLTKWDCPHLFELGGKHVLICYAHPMRQNRYFIGRYENRRFHIEYEGALDLGVNEGGTFSAAQPSYQDPKNRLVLVGMMQERFAPAEITATRAWSGALSLPRVMTPGEDGKPRFAPLTELQSLRGEPSVQTNIPIASGRFELLTQIEGRCLEVIAEIEPGAAVRCGMAVLCSPDGKETTSVLYDAARKVVSLKGIEQAFSLPLGEPLRLHVFVDRSLVEVFVNNRVCLSAWTYPKQPDSQGVGLMAEGTGAKARHIEAWHLRTETISALTGRTPAPTRRRESTVPKIN